MALTEWLAFILSFHVCNAISVTEVLSVNMNSPAITSYVNAGLLDPINPVVLVTTFSTIAANNNVLMLTDIILNSSADIVSVDAEALWPNQADVVDNNVINNEPAGIIDAGGFFVSVPNGTSYSTGSVDLYFQKSSSSVSESTFSKLQVSTDKTGYFYHKAGFLDANGDNFLDIMGARCYVPNYGSPLSELVVMTQPTSDDESWESTIVFNNGPDVSFILTDLDNDGSIQVISAEYFVNQRLSLYTCNHDHWIDCADGNGVSNITIDASEGTMFNLCQVDLNGDGIEDLLVTSQGNSGQGKVLAYELPKQGWNNPDAEWTKHELADGYAPLLPLPGEGSPGTAVSFPSPLKGGIKPWIVVSADDGGWVDLLVPMVDGQVDDWTYNKTRIVQSDGTVGTPSVGDLNNDGIPELVVPLYNENRIAVYTFNF